MVEGLEKEWSQGLQEERKKEKREDENSREMRKNVIGKTGGKRE